MDKFLESYRYQVSLHMAHKGEDIYPTIAKACATDLPTKDELCTDDDPPEDKRFADIYETVSMFAYYRGALRVLATINTAAENNIDVANLAIVLADAYREVCEWLTRQRETLENADGNARTQARPQAPAPEADPP
jgi:hypothetical protein